MFIFKIVFIFSIPESMLIFKPAKYKIGNPNIACETITQNRTYALMKNQQIKTSKLKATSTINNPINNPVR
jgi:hypothetical protein